MIGSKVKIGMKIKIGLVSVDENYIGSLYIGHIGQVTKRCSMYKGAYKIKFNNGHTLSYYPKEFSQVS